MQTEGRYFGIDKFDVIIRRFEDKWMLCFTFNYLGLEVPQKALKGFSILSIIFLVIFLIFDVYG
jgi:hypothetical protein